jgi:serine phosphatase RsbU (regulator of sigma subunit)
VTGDSTSLGELLDMAEDAAPTESIDVIARHLQDRLGAVRVSFLFVDLLGQELVQLTSASDVAGGRGTRCIRLRGSVYDGVLRTQQLAVEPDSERHGLRVLTPVTNRGDRIGVLEVILPRADQSILQQIREAAHALAYLIVTDRRFTEVYQQGRRTTAMSLAAEIQWQLLPSASCCEAAQFTIAAALVPADRIAGDTYDFTLDQDALHVSITDIEGHDVRSALQACLLVGALRGARRAGNDIAEQARAANRALLEHGGDAIATGQLMTISLREENFKLVNAGHPWPLRLRDGRVDEISLDVDFVFGGDPATTYRIQELNLRPGDRLILFTDGIYERGAAVLNLPALIEQTGHLHPRETVRALTDAVKQACQGHLQDDATVLCLDWHGSQITSRHTREGADIGDASGASPNSS